MNAEPELAVPEPVPVMQPQPLAAAPPPPVAVEGPAEGDLAGLWTSLVDAVGRASPFTRSYLLEAHPVSFAKNLFTIGFAPEFEDHLSLVDNSRNHTLLQTKLSELGHPNTQFKFIKADNPSRPAALQESAAPAPNPPAVVAPAATRPAATVATARSAVPQAAKEKLAPVPFNKDDFKNDPLIQKALEIFKGQIVEVRA